MPGTTERWLLSDQGRQHCVEITDTGWRRRLVWSVDGIEVTGRSTTDERVVLGTPDQAIGVRLPAMRGPARRVTLYAARDDLAAPAVAHLGVGGIDLMPEDGSAAARREQWIRDHPRRYTTQRTVAGIGKVVIPLLLAYLAARFAINLPWPDWRLPRLNIPWPDIGWPWIDLPEIDWPDIELPSLPAWVRTLLEAAKYVGPVLLAFVLARAELRRRRQQDARRTAAGDQQAAGDQEPAP